MFLILPTPSAISEEKEGASIKIPTADFTDLKHTKSGRIDKVIDALTILLKDGTVVRLSSIDIPDFHIWDDAPYSDKAFQLLKENLPERTEIMLYQTRNAKHGRVNRKNQQLAHVLIKNNKTWLQGLYLAHGVARVYTTPHNTDMLHQMYKAEEKARTAQIGIWQKDSPYQVISPEQAPKHIGEFSIIEGTVQKIATIRNNIYLNFGKDWKTDFTIMITPNLRKKLSHQAINLSTLAQTDVRVRGILREYNGPLIELEDITHLEILHKEEEPNSVKTDTDTGNIKAKKIRAYN